MKLKPLHDWTVIKRSEAEERSPGGIIIPDTAKDRPSEGIVVSIGPGSYKKIKGKEKFVPTTLQYGQRVAYPKYTAKEVEVGGEKFTLVREDDILGTFEGEKRAARKEPEQQDRPVVTREVKKTIPAMEGSSGKKKDTRKKAVRKSTKTAGEKKTKKKTLRKSITTKTGPKAVKKPGAKKREETQAKKKVTKKTAGTKKTTGGRSPSKGKTAQKKKTAPSPIRKKGKSQPQQNRKKTGRG
jgi:chaperonin GroES